MAYTEFNKSNLKVLREELNKRFGDQLQDLNLEVSFGNASFDSENVTFKCVISIKGGQSPEEKALQNFVNHAPWFMKDIDLEKIATIHGGRQIKISGYRNTARTKPWLAKDINSSKGEQFVLTDDDVKRLFAKETQDA
tara:strand:- start:58 stop:471 length:414 start_codon:yes stop_codon:yes gene_type:complete